MTCRIQVEALHSSYPNRDARVLARRLSQFEL